MTPLLNEYFAECEEHLDSIHRNLIVMEGFVTQGRMDSDVVDALLRALHSIKGLSAMASIREAEEAAHAMEGVLRDLKESAVCPTDGVLEVLVSGTSCIEGIIAAVRDRGMVPEGAERSCIGGIPAIASPRSCWLFQFSPSAELSARGVNVTSIRSRLQQIGAILNCTPRIIGPGQITFDFTVACDSGETGFLSWESDGVTVTPSPILDIPALHETVPATPLPSVIRVEMKRLDHLMTMLGDLVISRGHIEENLRELEGTMPASAWRKFQEANLLLDRRLRSLRESVLRVRMVPVGEIFERMRYVVRGLQRENHKDVRLELSGQGIEIDKVLVERMMDPLLHMVRNAISHGLEESQERIAAGKSPEGHLWLRASMEGETVVIEVEDDGRGVDLKQVTTRARAMRLIEDREELDSARLLQVVCAPGFSTREAADLGAGRGVGMAVVRATVGGLGGTLVMNTRPGQGTQFTIRLPLTLAILQALIIQIDDQSFAVPRSAVHEVLRIDMDTVTTGKNAEVIPFCGGVLPIVHLRRLFGMKANSAASLHVLVVGSDQGVRGVAVDRITGQREIVVRSLEDSLVRVPGIAGATELGDGRPVLILDIVAVVGVAEAAATVIPS